FGRLAVPRVNAEDYKFELGKGVTLRDGRDVTIVATGLLVSEALDAAEALKADGIDARVINIHTIKPIDRDLLIKAAEETGAIVTAEEHSVIGGLGGAVCEVLSEACPVPVLRLGVEDTFGRSGPAVKLLHLFGLDAAHIAEKAKKAVAIKK
ncbi:MAG: transketolase family protein, partial [Clostridia bacterium]|nr:transketolase family protein [Clostridia bacterium]